MKKLLLGLTMMALILMVGGIAYAGTTATQTFNVQISEINELTVSGNPGGLTASTATAGGNPNPVSDNSTTYSITTNGASKKITGQITTGANMPSSMFLRLTLAAPTVGGSCGNSNLYATSAQDFVTNISTVADGTGNTVTYWLGVNADAGTLTSTSKTITLTLCAQ